MYKPAFVHAYKSSKSSLPINVWAKAVGRRLPQFRNEEDIYSPVPLHIKIAGSLNDSNGAVRLSVMPTNPNWYDDLTDALSEMTGKRDVQVVSYLGKCVRDMSPEQLMAVGECDCVQSEALDAPIRLASVVPPPLHLSTNKQAELKEWWNNQRSPLAEAIAVQLKGMTMAEIAQATLADGPIHQTIQSHLTRNTLHNLHWDKFLSTFGNSGNTDATAMSNKLLDAVRQSLVANETQIRSHHASIGTEAALWKNQKVATSRYKDDFTLYRDIIEDAMYHPLVGQEMVHAILYGTRTIDGHNKNKKKKKKKTKTRRYSGENVSSHPINAYYSDYHYQVHGKLPGHRIAELNKAPTAGIASEYQGDAAKAVDMFNLFSGRAVQNTPIEQEVKSGPPELIPIECGACSRKKGDSKKKDKKGKSVQSRLPELIPIEQDVKYRMPERPSSLIPMAQAIQYAERYASELPRLIPIDQSMPPLVPIEQNVKSRMPELIPIEQDVKYRMPERPSSLIPMAQAIQYAERYASELPRLIPIDQSMPPLVPIAHMRHEPVGVPSFEELCEPIWVDDCPNLMDFLKK